jgi:hypothetical protein
MPSFSEQGIFMTDSTASWNEAGILAYNDGNYAEAFRQFGAAADAVIPLASICWPACITRAMA